MNGHRIEYVRVSSFDRNPERRVVVQALRAAGYAERQPAAPSVTTGLGANQGDFRPLPTICSA